MLALEDVSLSTRRPPEGKRLLDGINACLPTGQLAAIIGPSGCGKTSLLKLVAGIANGHETGRIRWMGRDLADEEFRAGEIAYVPQFSVAFDQLTAGECVRYSLSLRSRDARPALARLADAVLDEVGLLDRSSQLVSTFSGGQRRRLALALELTSRPHLFLCDEVTSGLDPAAEEEIVDLLHRISRAECRLVLSVTHSLTHIHRHDTVIVLIDGHLAFCAPPTQLLSHFQLEHVELLFARLRHYPAEHWAEAWRETQEYPANPGESDSRESQAKSLASPPARPPGLFLQFTTLFARRCRIFSRSHFQIFLHLALIIGFPLLVAMFAWGGLPEVRNLEMGLSDDLSRIFDQRREYLKHASEVGSVVSGIVLFQVILLTLMGANNSGREIAGERAIFEKERLAGLNPFAYVASKAAFLSILVIVQSLWMGAFVHIACQMPGSLFEQLSFLLLVNGAITAACLGISSLMDSPDHASIASVYFVGFQLPLSGAVLALPDSLAPLLRPFISAYWSWSGFLQTMSKERHYDIIQSVIQSPLATMPVSTAVLTAHIAVGLAVAWIGCERHRHL